MFRFVLAGLLLSTAPALAGVDPHAQEVLAAASKVMGGDAWKAVHFMRVKAHLATSGLAGTTESLVDAQTGAFFDRYDRGVAKGANGYDGKTVWQADDAGQVTIQG